MRINKVNEIALVLVKYDIYIGAADGDGVQNPRYTLVVHDVYISLHPYNHNLYAILLLFVLPLLIIIYCHCIASIISAKHILSVYGLHKAVLVLWSLIKMAQKISLVYVNSN